MLVYTGPDKFLLRIYLITFAAGNTHSTITYGLFAGFRNFFDHLFGGFV
jgi:hypothetical protein